MNKTDNEGGEANFGSSPASPPSFILPGMQMTPFLTWMEKICKADEFVLSLQEIPEIVVGIEEEVDLVEEDGIAPGLAHVLDPGPDPGDVDQDLDLIQEIGQNQDLQEILAETTGQDQDQLRGLRITTEKRMETDLHLEKERPQDLVLVLTLALGLDPEAIKFYLTLPKPTTEKLFHEQISSFC